MPYLITIQLQLFKDLSGTAAGITAGGRYIIPIILANYVNKIFEDDDYKPYYPLKYLAIVSFIG